jgi:hypothetical protein
MDDGESLLEVQATDRMAPEIIQWRVNWLVQQRHVQWNIVYNFLIVYISCKF